MMDRIATGLTWVLLLVSMVTLVVSGIGIMNIMLATVTSRIREIGIRKAVGATNREIRFQFLAEAILISLDRRPCRHRHRPRHSLLGSLPHRVPRTNQRLVRGHRDHRFFGGRRDFRHRPCRPCRPARSCREPALRVGVGPGPECGRIGSRFGSNRRRSHAIFDISLKRFSACLPSPPWLKKLLHQRWPRTSAWSLPQALVLDGRGHVLHDTHIVVEGSKIVAVDKVDNLNEAKKRPNRADYDLRGRQPSCPAGSTRTCTSPGASARMVKTPARAEHLWKRPMPQPRMHG